MADDHGKVNRTRKVMNSFQTSPQMRKQLEEAATREGVSMQRVVQRALADHLEKLDRRAWGTIDDDAYDPQTFYTFGSDSKGHSSQSRVNIPKPLRGEIQRLVESGIVPDYLTIQHFFRDAIFHRAKTVARWIENGELERVTDMAMLMSAETQIEDEEAQAENLLNLMGSNLARLMKHAENRGDYSRVVEYLNDRAEKSGVVPEAYREDYEAILRVYRKEVRLRKG